MDQRLTKALSRHRESKGVEFKESFDPSSPQEWCEVVKDVAAIANSGGGVIVFGLLNDGRPSGHSLAAVAGVDPAEISDKVYRYTRQQPAEFQVVEGTKDGSKVVGLIIAENPVPVAFELPGTYSTGPKDQKTAFGRGTVYFRHGAKSEPGTTDDIRQAFDRRLKTMRKEWLTGVRKVVSAPPGSRVTVGPQEVVQSTNPSAQPIRLTDDANAPAYRLANRDVSHPLRQKDVIDELRRRHSGFRMNSFDMRCVRRVHGIDQNLTYCAPGGRFSSPQFSNDFVDWLDDQLRSDPSFVTKARSAFARL